MLLRLFRMYRIIFFPVIWSYGCKVLLFYLFTFLPFAFSLAAFGRLTVILRHSCDCERQAYESLPPLKLMHIIHFAKYA